MNQDLVRIRKCELLDSYPLIRRNYSNFLHANYFSELLLKCEIPEVESNNYFDMLKKTIFELSNFNNDIEIKFNFELKLMNILGIDPNLETCVQCNGEIWQIFSRRNPLPKYTAPYQLDACLGGIRCPKCSIGNSFANYLNPGSMAFFYSRQKNVNNDSLVKPTLNNLKELDKAFNTYFRYFFGKNLKSHILLEENLWNN